MRIAVLMTIMFAFLVPVCLAAGPDALVGGSLPEPEALLDRSVQAQEDDAAPAEAAPGDTGDDGLADYYNRKMMTIEGVITVIDVEAGTIGIKNDDGENTYLFDELTRFQVKLRPIEPTALKVGSKMAGLYMQRDGALYISRVVVITGEKSKSRRRRRR